MRVFTEVELKELGSEIPDLIAQAIDAGDLEKAKKLAHQVHSEFFMMHEGFRDWIAALMSFVGRRLGDEGLYEFLHDHFQNLPELKMFDKVDFRRKVQMLAGILRGHLTSLRIEEDDEKVTIMMTPCGSGGRAVLAGSYGPPRNFLLVKKPQAMTLGRSDFPVYCCHCPLIDIIQIEAIGYLIWVTVPSEKIGEEPCRFILYKDPDKIPDEYYERFGLKKPKKEG